MTTTTEGPPSTRRRRVLAAVGVVALLGGAAAVVGRGGDDDPRDWPHGLVAVPLDGTEPRAVEGLTLDDLWSVESGGGLWVVQTPDSLRILDSRTGRALATHAFSADGVALPPVAWGDRAVLPVSDGTADGRHELWVLSVETGARLWVVDGDDATGRPIALDDDTLALVWPGGAAGPGRRLVEAAVLDQTGVVTARHDVELDADAFQDGVATALGGSLALVGRGEVVLVGSGGEVVRRIPTAGCPAAVGALDGDLLVGHVAGRCSAPSDEIARIDGATGEEVWRTAVSGTPPRVVETVEGSGGPVVLVDRDRPGAALDARDGDVLWTRDDIRATSDGLLYTAELEDGGWILQPRQPSTAEPLGPGVPVPDFFALAATPDVALFTA